MIPPLKEEATQAIGSLKEALLTQPTTFENFTLKGDPQRIELPPGPLAVTFCQTPIVYQNGVKSGFQVTIHMTI
ncbi:MAG: hypothetical protein HQ525_12970 [Anaerolineae bacterium]|nr:hypothetical protein [Anaerolineae bacterium]